jgi:hypothetical protein
MMSARKLGKLPAVPDPRIPRLRSLATTREVPPLNVDWWSKVPAWPMLDNDRLGDCVIAYVLHCVQQRRQYVGRPVTFGNPDADALYSAWAGWNGSPASDRGMLMTDALADWARHGVPISGEANDNIAGLASVDFMAAAWIRYAIWKCGGVGLGITCPIEWVEDVPPGGMLDVPGYLHPNQIAGGHAVYLAGYEMQKNGTFVYDCITWGDRYVMTGRALRIVGDEAYAVLDKDWLNSQGLDPAGLDYAQAEAAIAALGGRVAA